jgi:hypothetical protein
MLTMSLHKLTAGSGYDYLTRQVAALDATEKGHVGLAAYYTERGESPASGSAPAWPGSTVWTLATGDGGADAQPCSGAACTHSPTPRAAVRGPDLTLDSIEKAMRLGHPFGSSMGRRRSGSSGEADR